MNSAWDGDWRKRVHERVRALGHESPAAFADAHPGASFLELADMLGRDVAAVQLVWTLRTEAARNAEALQKFARSCLYRQLREYLPKGWEMGEQGEVPSAYGGWHTDLSDLYEEPADRVWDVLESLAPKGWLPASPDDPILLEAFQHWNAAP
jgi:hypothetical protein